jgi:hypothetical protein
MTGKKDKHNTYKLAPCTLRLGKDLLSILEALR